MIQRGASQEGSLRIHPLNLRDPAALQGFEFSAVCKGNHRKPFMIEYHNECDILFLFAKGQGRNKVYFCKKNIIVVLQYAEPHNR